VTLWELAQSWEHQHWMYKGTQVTHSCHRCQLEQWAREKAKELTKYENEGHDSCGLMSAISSLGVPEEPVVSQFESWPS